MAIEYVHTTPGGDITVKWLDGAITEEIHVENSINDLLVQDLLDAIRAAEDSIEGTTFGQIAAASGKETLGSGVTVGLTVQLLGDWKVYSTKSTGVFTVLGGNLVTEDGSSPFRPNNLITYVNVLSAAATIVTTEGGGGGDGFTSSDRTVLNGIEEALAGVASDIADLETAVGTLGTDLNEVGGDVTGIATTLATLNLDLTFLKSKRSPKTNDDVSKKIKSLESLILDLGKQIRRSDGLRT